jgi:formimidoylglutamate deiminase
MLLEYGQRLQFRQRNLLATAQQKQVASAMWQQAVQGGAQASGRTANGLAAGQRADFCVLDGRHIALAGLDAPDMLSAHVFASHRSSALEEVWVAGQPVARHGSRHPLREQAAKAFIESRSALIAQA